MNYENLPRHEAINPYNRDWTLSRGVRQYSGWMDDLCDKRGSCSRYWRQWQNDNQKRRTLRTFRDGSAARWSRY